MNVYRPTFSDAFWRPFCLILPLAGCGEVAGTLAETAIVRDSAGVEIVENRGRAWGADEAWRLTPEPLLEIGLAEGSTPYLLDRVAGARRLPDGRVVIANGGSGELRYFTADGVHLKSVGGQGEGPGEYRSFAWLDEYRGDSLFVYDPAARRASVLSQEGQFGRVLSFPSVGDGGPPNPAATLSDGSILGRLTVLVGRDEIKTGMQKSDARYGRFSGSDGAWVDSIATLPGEERHLLMEAEMLMITRPLIGPETHVAAAEGRIFLGHGGSFEVRQYSANGTLERLIRRVGGPVPVTAEELARLQEDQLADSPSEEMRRRLSGIYAMMPAPEARPAFTDLAADEVGNLWVREATLPWEPNRWSIFDSIGLELGTLELPAGFRPHHIGEDFILGVVSDDLDVQRVRIYRIDKGGR